MAKDNLFLYVHDKIYLKVKAAKKAKKENDELKASLVSIARAARPLEMIEREHRLLTNPSRKIAYTFRNRTNPNDTQKFIGTEHTQFKKNKTPLTVLENGQTTIKNIDVPDYTSQNIYHGVLTIKNYNEQGNVVPVKKVDIYMYQPRFDGANDVSIGPLTFPNGELNSTKAYMYKKDGNVYIGQIPKREVLSDVQFDLENPANIAASIDQYFKEDETKYINDFITLEMDRVNGLMVPVNFNDPKQKKKFLNYCAASSPSRKAEELRTIMDSLKKQLRIKKENIAAKEAEERQREYAAQQAALEAQEQQERASKEQKAQQDLAQKNQQMLNEALTAQRQGTYVSYNAENMAQNHGYMDRRNNRPVPPPPGGPAGGPRPGRR